MNFKPLQKLIYLLFICVLCLTNINAQNSKSRQPRPFPLKVIFPGDENYLHYDVMISRKLKIGTSTAVLQWKNDEFTFRGKNKYGKSWKVKFDAAIGYEAYLADFDKNGLQDLLFISYTTSNGFLPNHILQFILFDKTGQPVPFFIPADADINDIVDLNKNGRAEFRFCHYNWGTNKWTGYFITDIYEAKDARWEKLKNIQGRKLPIFTSYKGLEDRNTFLPISERPVKGQDKFSPNYANDKPLSENREFLHLSSSNSDYCYFQQTLRILDSKDGRQISFIDLDKDEDAQNLLKGATKVELYGQCQPEKAFPYMIWVVK